MSKRILRIGGAAVAILAIVLAVRFFFFKTHADLRSVYLIPESALFIIETEEPLQNWFDLVNFPAWKRLGQIEYFAAVNAKALGLDSLINANSFFLKLVGDRPITISGHLANDGKLSYLYTIDLQNLSLFHGLKNQLLNLSGDDISVTSRQFNGREIIEIFDRGEREFLYLSLVENHLVASYDHLLLEASIETVEDPKIGRDPHFIDVSAKIAGRDMCRTYLSHRLLKGVFTENRDDNKLAELFFTDLIYSGFSFSLDEGRRSVYGEEVEKGLISMHGFSSIRPEGASYFKAFAESGNSKQKLFEIASSRAAVYAGLGFDDFGSFYENLEAAFAADSAVYAYYRQELQKVEKRLGVDVREHFLSWIGDEIAFVQLKPAYKSLAYETAVIFRARDKEQAQENLAFITDQIRKNTPARFKSVSYKGCEINYLSVSGLLKLLFGKLINNMEKPYFTMIEDAVIFSAHPQTLKSMIDDYQEGRTLANEREFEHFRGKFDAASSLFFYINSGNALPYLRQILPDGAAKAVVDNSRYLERFPQVGMQLISRGGLFEARAAAEYSEAERQFNTVEITAPYPSPATILAPEEQQPEEKLQEPSRVIIDDLDSREQVMHYESGAVKLEAKLKRGVKHGAFREYYESGALKIKGRYKNDQPDGLWRFYNEEGDVIKTERYP